LREMNQEQMSWKRWELTAVILGSLVVRLLPVPFVIRLLPQVYRAGIANDGVYYYWPLAVNLAEHGEFSIEPGHPTAFQMPLYPLVVSSLHLFRLLTPTGLVILQGVLGAAVLTLLYVWVRALAGRRVAVLALCCAAVVPEFAVFSYLNLSENLAAVLVLAGFCLFARAMHSRSSIDWFLVGAALGLATLTREFCVTFVPLLAGFALWREGYRSEGRGLVVMILSTIFVLVPWMIRNYGVVGEFTPLTTKGALNVYVGTLKGDYHPSDARRMWRNPDTRQSERDRSLKEAIAATESRSERDRLYLRASWENVREDPEGQIVYLIKKVDFFWQSSVGVRHAGRVGSAVPLFVAEVLYWVSLMLGATALLSVGARRNLALLWIVIGWTFLFHVLVGEAEPRYHFLAMPAVFGLAGFSLSRSIPAVHAVMRSEKRTV
jgi:4-amino-4-deoxy-L-arabinose transferase-like glycosyltransferase